MEVRCKICANVEEISKVHKDYQRLANAPKEVYVCRKCSKKIQYQAKQEQEPKKPI